MDDKQLAGVTILGGLSLAVGSFLPWFESAGTKASGVQGGDGWVTAAAGVMLVLSGLAVFRTRPLPNWVPVGAVAAGLLVAIAEFYASGSRELTIGTGMWLVVAGSVLGLVGLLIGRRKAA